MRSLGWAVIQSDWYLSKKRRLGHRHAQREDHVRTQGEGGCLQAKDRGLRRNQTWEFPGGRVVRALTAEGPVSILSRGTKIPQAAQCGQKKKKKERKKPNLPTP